MSEHEESPPVDDAILRELRAINDRLGLILRTLVTMTAFAAAIFATICFIPEPGTEPWLAGVVALAIIFLFYHSNRTGDVADSDRRHDRPLTDD